MVLTMSYPEVQRNIHRNNVIPFYKHILISGYSTIPTFLLHHGPPIIQGTIFAADRFCAETKIEWVLKF